MPDVGTAVPNSKTFSENLLRAITGLRAKQQVELVRKLARGKNSKANKYTKADFNEEASRFRIGNELEEQAVNALAERMAGDKLDAAIEDVKTRIRDRVYIEAAAGVSPRVRGGPCPNVRKI